MRLSLQLWSCGGHHPEQCVQEPRALLTVRAFHGDAAIVTFLPMTTNDSQTDGFSSLPIFQMRIQRSRG